MSPPTPYRRPRRLLALGAAFLLVIGGGSWSSAGPEADDDQLSSEDTYPTVAKDPDLDSHLAEIASTYDEEGSKAARSEAESSGADVKHQKVRVVLDVEPGERAAVEDRIRELGGEVEGDFAARIQALLPPSTIEDAADDAGVRYAHLPEPAEPQAVTGEGVGVTGADDWHGRGFTGDGVKVAIVDGGFAGFTDRQTEGDLPAGLTTRNFCADGFTSETDHGTAVAEILYEMAPDADLFLVCALNAVELGQALTYVKSVGVDIVSRSVGSFNTGRGDGTGGPGTADGIVADAVRSGILWVNAAGNHAHSHWGGRFSDADGDDFHNFTPTDEGNTVVMPAGEQLCFALRWDDWPRSDQDYDLGLHRSSDLAVVAASVDPQTGTQPPTEFLCYTSATTAAYTVSILKFDATETPRFDLFAVQELPFEHQVPAGSIVEPASSPDAFAVGAFCWQDGSLQSYSSRGPTIDGRTKPDILGP
ncbi:MAG: S8 family serine peptidase, partial [Actinomycetota bacterium]